MTVNIWKSYTSTAVEETNIEVILAVINTAELVVEIKPEKNSGPHEIPYGPVSDFLSVKPGLTKYVLWCVNRLRYWMQECAVSSYM